MKNICLNWTISIITGMFVLFLMSSVGFIFHIPINQFYLPISIISFFIVFLYLSKNCSKKLIIAQLIILLDIVILSALICYFIPDFSYDGTTYHQAIIILLKWGLNPIYDNISAFINNQEYVFSSSIPYVEGFLKFYEIIGANIYKLGNKIELTKTIHYVFALCAFCYSYYTLRNFYLSKIRSILFSILLIYNPVCIYQMLSNYVDGDFYYLFLILTFALVNYVRKYNETKNLYLIGISTIMFANLKLTGLFTSALVILIFVCVYKSKKLLLTSCISAIFILVCGINPYFTNINKNKNPFYPIVKNNIFEANKEFMLTSYPQGFENMNRFEKLCFSTFAVSKNLSPLIHSEDVPRLKLPFTIDGDDTFIFEDMRLGGFGYFFSGILILTLILGMFLRFQSKDDKKMFFVLIAAIFLSVIGNHEAWWARFVPQMWMIPILVLIFFEINKQKTENIVMTAHILALICFVNSLTINVQYFSSKLDNAIKFHNFIKDSSKVIYISKEYPKFVHTFETQPVKFLEYGIKTIYVDEQ